MQKEGGILGEFRQGGLQIATVKKLNQQKAESGKQMADWQNGIFRDMDRDKK